MLEFDLKDWACTEACKIFANFNDFGLWIKYWVSKNPRIMPKNSSFNFLAKWIFIEKKRAPSKFRH